MNNLCVSCQAVCGCGDCKLYLSSNQSVITEDQGQGLWEHCVLGSVSQSDQWEVWLVTSRASDWLKHNIVDITAVVQPSYHILDEKYRPGWRWAVNTSVSINTESRVVRPRQGYSSQPVSQQPVSWLTSYWGTSSCSLFLCELWTQWKHTERQTVTVREQWRETGTWGHQGTRLNGKYVQCWGWQFSGASWHYTVTLADCYELSLPNITLIKPGRYQDKNSLYWNTQTSNLILWGEFLLM